MRSTAERVHVKMRNHLEHRFRVVFLVPFPLSDWIGLFLLPLVLAFALSFLSLALLSLLSLLVPLLNNRQGLVQRVGVLRILENLIHLQEVSLLSFWNSLDAYRHLLGAIVLLSLLLLLGARVFIIAATHRFVEKAQEHGVVFLAVLRFPVVGIALLLILALVALLLIEQDTEFVQICLDDANHVHFDAPFRKSPWMFGVVYAFTLEIAVEEILLHPDDQGCQQ